jgi:Xaa-Pro dipeptidase
MSKPPFFPKEEYQARLQNVRQRMAGRGLDACLITSPENIFYLTGLNHQGFFTYHGLLVPRAGVMQLITRAMERVTVENQLDGVEFVGHADGDDPASVTVNTLTRMGLASGRLGMEKETLLLSPRIAEALQAQLVQARWLDVSGLVDELRLVKSGGELAYVRRAAAVSDAMMQAALDTARVGVSEREIAAEVHHAMILAGGDYPGFIPFIRSTPRLGEEHTTWSDRILEPGDTLFLEMAGCVARYHAPLGRLVFVTEAPAGTEEMATVCLEAFRRVVEAIRPGVTAARVYQAWQERVDAAGLTHYRRHHCGYLVGTGFPPSWVGGNRVVGLRYDSDLVLKPGMTFHLLSWLMGAGRGNYFVSDTALLTENGCEVLTGIEQQVRIV